MVSGQIENQLVIETPEKRSTMVSITVVILTHNESIHIRRAIDNVIDWCDEVVILDSNSTDDTAAIAEACGAKVYYRAFDNYAAQRNYAIHDLPLQNEWMLFLDADEYLGEALKEEIANTFKNPLAFDGFLMKRRFIFNDKWIKHGGYYPIWLVRLFKRSAANVDREINEHVAINGTVGRLEHFFSDHNLKPIADWIDKHNRYSNFEAKQFLFHAERKKNGGKDGMAKFSGDSVERKRWIREHIWNDLPPLLRPFFYFFWRYILRLGILDGKAGLIYHFLHGFWYPFITDVKYLEMKKGTTP